MSEVMDYLAMSPDEFRAELARHADGLILEAGVRLRAMENVLAQTRETLATSQKDLMQAQQRCRELDADATKLQADLDGEREVKMKTLASARRHVAKLTKIEEALKVADDGTEGQARRALTRIKKIIEDA